ncbi:hypothetical protein QP089_48215 [Actinomadura sp. OS1-43]|nr:hypothetical protein [Actinomadura sp. OS1-43]MDL4822094.1 hypothetical protein [Actinomadura sp. OS1-43]
MGAPRDGAARQERSGGRRRGERPAPPPESAPIDPPSYGGDHGPAGSAPSGYPDPPYTDPAYTEPPYAEPPYAEPPYAEPPYAEPPYAEPPYAEPPYAEPPYAGPGYPDQDFYQQDPAYADAPYEGEEPLDAPVASPAARRPARARKPRGRAKTAKTAKSGKARAPGQPDGPVRRSTPGSGGPGAKLYFGAAAALAVLVVIGLVAAVTLGGGGDGDGGGKGGPAGGATRKPAGSAAGNGNSPDSYSSSPSSSAYAAIASRKTDAKPLTAGEAFPSSASKLSPDDANVRLTLRAKKLDGDCTAAVWGASVAAELARGGCTQAAREIYSDTRHGYGLAVAVFNLAGSADADRFVGLLDRTLGAGFVLPLPAQAPLDRFGQGFGMARGLAMGHYAVVSWAQRLDGTGDESDETLLSLLIEGGKAPAVLGRAAAASH